MQDQHHGMDVLMQANTFLSSTNMAVMVQLAQLMSTTREMEEHMNNINTITKLNSKYYFWICSINHYTEAVADPTIR